MREACTGPCRARECGTIHGQGSLFCRALNLRAHRTTVWWFWRWKGGVCDHFWSLEKVLAGPIWPFKTTGRLRQCSCQHTRIGFGCISAFSMPSGLPRASCWRPLASDLSPGTDFDISSFAMIYTLSLSKLLWIINLYLWPIRSLRTWWGFSAHTGTTLANLDKLCWSPGQNNPPRPHNMLPYMVSLKGS